MTGSDPARARFFILQLVRLVGVAMVLGGLAITQGAIDLPPAIGVVLIALGFVEVFFLPRLLARQWKSPDA